ncbi:mating-type alpha-pheromone receptor PreB [Histoplasma capsulatum G186AR]|uniref:Mating-type alpha-pheromone receptor PreB n=2 Tax=Ajellomyces capsulatus TaxID=5037 RepID=C0NQ16_AJECG|nr:mating-type alpha-pheromone receptor PreB [Histoplasma capsulatum G186AR]EEH07026.1 mating-type alpha-pheromone receptor PreB [Histoplasma capsulatum G186AR]KAG5293947.1 mating-type alpha-pheromone receptor PreB [Histoplasma capsulatum]QSS75399.1 mating-type alpha-pheromone receptor PreB [Histoplasma capsulatum G186AR]
MSSSFDPFDQNVVFHKADGTPFNVSIHDLDEFVQYGIRVCINYAAQLGATVIAIVMLALLTQSDKRRTPVFFLNTSALTMNFARLLCMTIYFTTGFNSTYAFFSLDYSRVPGSAYADSILGIAFATILVICMEMSLVIQTQVVCATLSEIQRRLLLVVSILIALLAIGFRMGLMVENCIAIMNASNFRPFIWLQSASNIAITISTCFFSAVFVTKLGYALVTRRRLGMTRFGAMQVMFIMSFQTMVIPAIFSIIQYPIPLYEMNSNVFTLVAIFLPLSSLWAAAATKHSFETLTSGPHQYLWSSERSNSTSSATGHQGSLCQNQSTIRSGGSVATSLSPDQLDRLYTGLDFDACAKA